MADAEHITILENGVETWNHWRKGKTFLPDLSYEDLSGENLASIDFTGAYLVETGFTEANLSGADLRFADLTSANLSGANLGEANLRRANLSKADIKLANLNGADLRRADFSEADLRGTDLSKADLSRTNLSGAILCDEDNPDVLSVNLTRAKMKHTIFTPEGKSTRWGSFLDLATCIGLETAEFSYPDFLPDYLTKAFEYAHKTNTYEALKWPNFFQRAIENIKSLHSLYTEKEATKNLIEVVHVINCELIKYLKKHPEALYQIKPRQFEELVAEILASYGWDVQLTPAIKDGGYDIFAISQDIKPRLISSWVIECKKYGPENKVGVDIVRALYGVKSNLKVSNSLLATTSYFTKGAKAFKASRYDIELKDYRSILEWINQYRPNPNGKLYIKDNKLILP